MLIFTLPGFFTGYGQQHQKDGNTPLHLLKPNYPVNQVTVYLETEGMNLPDYYGEKQYGYYYAPGLQYARGKATFDASLQLPLAQQVPISLTRRWAGLIGVRYIL